MPQTEEEKALKNKLTAMRATSSKGAMVIYNLWNFLKIVGSKVSSLQAITPIIGVMYRLGYIITQTFALSFNLSEISKRITVRRFKQGLKRALKKANESIREISKTILNNPIKVVTAVIRGVIGFAAIGIAIAKLIFSAIPGPVAILSDITDALDSAWSIGLSVKSFFSGAWKRHTDNIQLKIKEHSALEDAKAHPDDIRQKKSEIIELENKIINKKAKLAGRIEGLVINAMFLTGSVMLVFFPPLAIVGFSLLAVTGLYVLLDKFNVNPFKRIANAIFGNPFKNKTVEAVHVTTPANTNTPSATPIKAKTSSALQRINSISKWIGGLLKNNKAMNQTNAGKNALTNSNATITIEASANTPVSEKIAARFGKALDSESASEVSDNIATHFNKALDSNSTPTTNINKETSAHFRKALDKGNKSSLQGNASSFFNKKPTSKKAATLIETIETPKEMTIEAPASPTIIVK